MRQSIHAFQNYYLKEIKQFISIIKQSDGVVTIFQWFKLRKIAVRITNSYFIFLSIKLNESKWIQSLEQN